MCKRNHLHHRCGALIMFYMALRSVRQRRSLCSRTAKKYRRASLAQCRAGTARPMCWSSPRRAAATGCSTPNPPAARILPRADVVTLYYDPEAPEKMYVEGDKSVLGAEALYAGIGVALLVLMFALL